MSYLIAIILPPLGLLLAGRPGQAIRCVLLWATMIGWPIAAIWAVLVLHSKHADERTKKLIEAQHKAGQAQVAAMQAMANQQLAASRTQMDMQAAQAAYAAQFAAMQVGGAAPVTQPTPVAWGAPAPWVAPTPVVVRTEFPVAPLVVRTEFPVAQPTPMTVETPAT